MAIEAYNNVRPHMSTDIDAIVTYQYNDKNLPLSMAINGAGINAFTYNCK